MPLIGTMTEPSPADVRQGVQYGAGGTEFTGILVAPVTPTLGPSIAATVADFVVAWLNDPVRGWTTSGWTAVRTWAPDADLQTLSSSGPTVEVVPDSTTPEEQETRAAEELTWTAWIVIRQKYSATGAIPNSWVDTLAQLAEQITDQLRNLNVTTVGFKCYCEKTELDPLIDPDELRKQRVAVSVIRADFREWRAA